ncbi:MAG: ATP-binding cassette domain-containing protein, partial [Planctomycetota bacterium]
ESLLPGTGPLGLALRDLEVRYPDATRAALQVPALTIQPGEHLGLVGANGSGKSTLADVLFGLRTPASGTVLFDGVDIRQVPLHAVRDAVALVRGIELFPGSIVDNVRLGRADLGLDEVTRVLDAVGLLEELRHLPEGLDTELHPHGRPLSHRQAGRLMIARALAGRPRLLVLDGALDLIDQPDEQARLDAVLFAPDAPWTTLCITDRPDVLARCARVVRLRDGAIEEETR